MPTRINSLLRRHVRAIRRAEHFPVLLPHFQIVPGGAQTLQRVPERLSPATEYALRLCDGGRTLREVAQIAGISTATLLKQHDASRIILWHSSLGTCENLRNGKSIDHIILAPHPDDAVLSLGAELLAETIDESGKPRGHNSTLIVDVFSRTAWTRFPEDLGDMGSIQTVRDAEEQLVMLLLGAQLEMLGLPEVLLRGRAYCDIFTAPRDFRDEEASAILEVTVRRLHRLHPRARWSLPLCIGNHLDHRIVRDVGLGVLEKLGVPLGHISFYEELPYAAEEGGVPDYSEHIRGRILSPRVRNHPDHTMAWKLELNKVYWSQITWPQIRKMADYALRIGGLNAERQWVIAEGSY